MNSTLGSLEPVDLRTIWPDEARDFTPWLAQEENLRRLSDALNLELELDRVEVAVGPYSADIVATDASSNNKVVIENQLEKTNHDHLGKVLTYASGLEARILIWIAKKFTEEHRQTFDYLNECTSGRLRLYGVEVEVLRIGNSIPAPHFKLVSTPNDYVAATHNATAELSDTKRLYLEFWSAFRDFCAAAGTTGGTPLQLRQPWPKSSRKESGLQELAAGIHGQIPCQEHPVADDMDNRWKLGRPVPTGFGVVGSEAKNGYAGIRAWPRHWYGISIGRSRFDLSLTVKSLHQTLGCELYLRGPTAKQSFKRLKEGQKQIEAALGPLDWQELPEGQDCRIVDSLKNFDPRNRSEWEKGFSWLKNRAEEFRSVFGPRVKALPFDGDLE
jgi:hypothetical protein